jgi:glycerol-3-phosphate O-acyltransferase
MLRASYYRNTIVHFFVPRGLAEIALKAPDLESFWTRLLNLRDLLKFEFFFAEKDEFCRLVAAELSADQPDWERQVERGDGPAIALAPATAAWAVAPLMEAYAIVADELIALVGPLDEKAFLSACVERGRQYRLEGRIGSDEAVSQVLFGGALLLADNRGLTDETAGAEERRHLADEIWAYIDDV